ncbi:hypothetical protein P5V15_007178 [Pogonomyrmex californicus]
MRGNFRNWKRINEGKKNEREEEEGVIWGRMKYGKNSLRIVGIYVNRDLENKLKKLKEWMEGRTIIGRDFNARTVKEGGRISINREETRRRSKEDK